MTKDRTLAEIQRDSNDLWQAIHREVQAGYGVPTVQMNRLHWMAALAEIEVLRGVLARATFAKNRLDHCTWILYLLEDEQISVGKAAEWLREYIHDAKEGALPPVHHYVGGEGEPPAPHCDYHPDRLLECAYCVGYLDSLGESDGRALNRTGDV